jgi:hypothetical protein
MPVTNTPPHPYATTDKLQKIETRANNAYDVKPEATLPMTPQNQRRSPPIYQRFIVSTES